MEGMRWVFVFFAVGLLACAEEQTPNSPVKAGGSLFAVERVEVESDTYQQLTALRGSVEVTAESNIVTLTMTLTGLEPGTSHAVHLHDGTCESPGAHWNQNTMDSFCGRESMGFPWNRNMAGDIGNVTVDNKGEGMFMLQTDLWSLNTGLDSDIVGKVLVVHQYAEDLSSACYILSAHDHSGNPKIACGDIQVID